MERFDLRGCDETKLQIACQELGLKKFRAQQVFDWVQNKAVGSWEEMRNISVQDRQRLKEKFIFQPLRLLREQRSQDGTRKYLFQLADGENIECVLMDYDRVKSRDRRTVCISTQVGCAVGCTFCATGMGGWKRNLTTGEIMSQVLDITHAARLEDPEFHVTNVVFMGMGEPLLNYEHVMQAIRLLNEESGQHIGMRRMTLSTSGVVPRILDLARDYPQVGLAISLHAATDEARDDLIPLNRRYPLASLMQACQEYSEITRRRITFEVALRHGQGTREMALQMAQLLQGQLCHVNLIPVNPIEGARLKRPAPEELAEFAKVLENAGIPVSIREERGIDIDAACGQLRQRWEEKQQ